MSEGTDTVLTVEKRDQLGKEAVNRLRREGRIPAVVYGGGKPPVAITVEERVIRDLLKESGDNTIFLLKLKGGKEERRAMVKEIQVDPMSGRYIHADFIRVTRGQKLTVNVAVELTGEPAGVKTGGHLDFVTREIQIEVLPREMISHVEVDVSHLEIGDNITLGDVVGKLPESATLLDDPERVIAQVATARMLEVEEVAEEEGEEELEESAEPEVIGRGKEEEEE